jgi:exo-beta-1,3-glucanase (GH17 family)
MRNPYYLAVVWCLLAGCLAAPATSAPPGGRRPLQLEIDGRWIGHGVSFSPYRDGQEPGRAVPSEEEILADLQLVAPYWQLLRMYDSNPVSERTLALIGREKLPLRLLLGVWIAPEHDAEARAANEKQAATAIRLANAYPDIVVAVVVGNETCVYWSAHRVGPDALIPWIRQVRTAVTQPVTTADDYNFWNKPESYAVAVEVDFITLHGYALWNGQQVEDAMGWTNSIYDSIVRLHPGIPVIFGETGWSTSHEPAQNGPDSEGTLMKGEGSVRAQESYLRQHYQWVSDRRIPVLLFEAFDENWKGGGATTSPAASEKHWGVFTADRKPKPSFEAIIRDFYGKR